MELRPAKHADTPQWRQLEDLWCRLPHHPNLLEVVERRHDETLLLRYAVIDWKRQPLSADRRAIAGAKLASWGAQIIDVYAACLATDRKLDITQLVRPFVKIDLGDAARVGFLPVVAEDPEIAVELPPELVGSRARADERAMVYAIGRLLRELAAGLEYPGRIIERCIHDKPSKRFRNLDDLQRAWVYASREDLIWEEQPSDGWRFAEEGFGWLALGEHAEAKLRFERARALDPNLRLARLGLRLFVPKEPSSGATKRHASRRRVPRHEWPDVAARGAALEDERAFAEALALYSDVRVEPTHETAIFSAIARCQLALGVAGPAIDYAQRVLVMHPRDLEALSIRARAYLLAGKPHDALRSAESWLAVEPGAAAHYARGRALLALERFEDARDAFDRAGALQPGMVEAMLLRREADRAIRRVRAEVGMQPELVLELPPHLERLRDALVSGRIADMLRVLELPEYEHDPIAQLFRARCLSFIRRFDDAIPAFERVARSSPEHERAALLGKAQALLAADRAGEALRVFDDVLATEPGELDAIEGRAHALRQLGRAAEADAELQRVIAASGRRSELRVGAIRRGHHD